MAEKKYYSNGEISELTDTPPYTIRYWEKLGLIRPLRLVTGHRRYTASDIETIKKIKDLMDKSGFTPEGVKKMLLKEKKQKTISAAAKQKEDIEYSKTDLLNEIHDELKKIIRTL